MYNSVLSFEIRMLYIGSAHVDFPNSFSVVLKINLYPLS